MGGKLSCSAGFSTFFHKRKLPPHPPPPQIRLQSVLLMKWDAMFRM